MSRFFHVTLAIVAIAWFGGPPQAHAEQQVVAVKGLDEMLVPTGEASAVEMDAVLAAKEAFSHRTAADDISVWTSFLVSHPQSPYRLAVLTNVGLACFRSGRFSEALSSYEQAWTENKAVKDVLAEALVGRAVGELAMMYARLGRYESLEALFTELGRRTFQGPGSNLLDNAQAGFQLMKAVPETSFRCGPMALGRILASLGKADSLPPAIRGAVSTRQGMSLVQVRDIAAQVGLGSMKPMKRVPGAPVVTPAVVHWKVGHYAALVREENGRYLVEDPTFAVKKPIWVRPETLDAEASGYFLVAADALPAGWSAVADEEAATVWGKGQTGQGDPDATGPGDSKSGGNSSSSSSSGGPPCGMAQWSVHSMLVSLNIADKPLGYNPPVGPPVGVLVTYDSRENETLSTPPHTSFGPKWSFNCLAYVADLDSSAVVHGGLGGSETFGIGSDGVGFSRQTYSTLRRTSPTPTFERVWPDGTKEVFGLAGPTGLAYRTQVIDPAGNTLTYQYLVGATTMLVSKIVDALGRETLFEYAHGGTTPTKVTDPFGRTAVFQYDVSGRLTSITDMAGIVSQFSYQDTSSFIQTLTTPYGSTQFATGFSGTTRWLEATYPNGDKERMETRHNADGIPSNTGAQPVGMSVSSSYYNYRNALYWDRKAMNDAPGDVSAAVVTHFLHTPDGSSTSGLVEAEKRPLEGWVYYNYMNQGSANVASLDHKRTRVGRILDDGSTQLYQMEYNDFGNISKTVDPVGRIMLLTYAANLTDVIEVRQQLADNSTVLLSSCSYNAQHLPVTLTDGGGNTTTFTYNARGQLLTMVRPNGDTITYDYDSNGYLTSVDGPLAGTSDKGTLAYDAKGRLATITDAAGMTLSVEYDNLDRPTKRTYPDGSFEQWTYDGLNIRTSRTRGGRVITFQHNALQQIVEADDDTGRKTLFDWCKCGALKSIIDPRGNMTRFLHDVQGRLLGKVFPDGTATHVIYGALSGRVIKSIDEQGHEQNYTYTADDRLAGLSYSGTGPATPAVSMVWDPVYPRLSQYTDGTGTTVLGYNPIASGQNGAGLVSSIDGPLANDTVLFTHDVLGRVTSRSINGIGETLVLDKMDRATSITNPLGTFAYAFEGASSRLASVTMPGGKEVDMTYQSLSGLKLLKDITNKGASGAEVSKFSYAYNVDMSPTGITRTVDGGAAMADTPSYDSFQQLIGYTKGLAGGGTQAFTYSYDSAGNRTSETISGATTTADVNVLNQITQLTPPPATGRTYEWDGAGRMTAIVIGTHRSEFSYDAMGRRARIVEKDNGVVTTDRRFVWVGMEIAEERDAANTVVKRFFAQGFVSSAGSFYYTRDHLGSIREVLDAAGVVRARYDYDPFGRRVKLSGDIDADYGFACMFYHAPSQLDLTYGRVYDPALGRWISRDPTGETSGTNLYAYVLNNPVSHVDLLGMDITPYSSDRLGWGGQYGDMMINTGKLLASAAALGSAATIGVTTVTVALALTVASAPALAAVAVGGAVVVSAVAVGWAGYGLYHASHNLTLNALGYQNDQDGNPIKDFWKICGDSNDPNIKTWMAVRDGTAALGDVAVGLGSGALAATRMIGKTAAGLSALPAAADAAGLAAEVIDLTPHYFSGAKAAFSSAASAAGSVFQ